MGENTKHFCRTCGSPVVGRGKRTYCQASCNPRNQPRRCPTCDVAVYGQGIKYCSDGCRPRCVEENCHGAAIAKQRCPEHYHQQYDRLSRPVPVYNCRNCGGVIAADYRSRKWCSDDCRPRCVEVGCDRLQRTAKRCGYHYRTDGPRRCLTCGTTVRDKLRYCSAECLPQCTVEWCTGRGKTLGYCDRHYAQLRANGTLATEFSCGICGVGIPAVKADGSFIKASTRLCVPCRSSYRSVSQTSVNRLLTRDGPICSLCFTEIDLTFAWPDPRSASIDHVLPRSLGGSNDLENLALSHLGCNCSKGNRVD